MRPPPIPQHADTAGSLSASARSSHGESTPWRWKPATARLARPAKSSSFASKSCVSSLRAATGWLPGSGVSQTRGDSIGFDVLSFEESGRERLVEVKTTAYGRETPFFVTRNELETSAREAPQYFLYRVFDFRRQPRLFHKQGQLDRAFSLDPVQYVASVL